MFTLPMDTGPVESKSAEIVIRQQPVRDGCSLEAPRWGHIQPTPSLTQHGLTAKKLREIIDSINAQSITDFENNYNPIFNVLVYIPIMGMMVGVGVSLNTSFARSPEIFIAGWVMAFLSGIASFFVGGFSGRKYCNATHVAMSGMREYVETTLNEQWQDQSGIRWAVTAQQTYRQQHHPHYDYSYKSYRNLLSLGLETLYNIQVMLLDPTVPMAVSAPRAPGFVDSNNDGEGDHYQ